MLNSSLPDLYTFDFIRHLDWPSIPYEGVVSRLISTLFRGFYPCCGKCTVSHLGSHDLVYL